MATSDPFTPTTSNLDTRTTSSVKEKVSEAATQAREKAAELAKNAASAIDTGMHTAAHKLQDTASSLRSTGTSGSSRVTNVANRAADGLESTARYMQDYSTNDLVSGLEQMVRRNPGPSLVAAAAVGFLIGTALRREDH